MAHYIGRTNAALAVLLISAAASVCFAADLHSPVPTDAALVIQRLIHAAESQDWDGVRSMMTEDFTYSLGNVEPGADAAIRSWKNEPQVLVEMQQVLRMGCGFMTRESLGCSGKGGFSYRAGIYKVNGEWKLKYFVAGD